MAIIRAHPANFAPGAEVEYSDSNYILLQLIVEQLTRQSLGTVIKEKILDPEKLDRTSSPTSSDLPAPFTRGHLGQPLGPPRDVTISNPDAGAGAGAMVSSLDDLKHWAKGLATGKELSHKLQHERLRKRPLVTGRVTLGYGLGIIDLNGFLGHNGGILGYSTAMFYLQEEDVTIVVEANQDNVGSVVGTAIFVSIASYLYPEQFPKGA